MVKSLILTGRQKRAMLCCAVARTSRAECHSECAPVTAPIDAGPALTRAAGQRKVVQSFSVVVVNHFEQSQLRQSQR